MKIVIIGAGNTATVLGRLFKLNNHQIIHIFNRNIDSAKILAKELGCSCSNFIQPDILQADLYVIAITDSFLGEIEKYFNLGNTLVVHTAGSITKEVLKNVSTQYGVLYPFQSLRKEMNQLPEIPFLVDGNNNETILSIENFAKTVSPLVKTVTDNDRIKMHVAGVFVNNFTNHLYNLVEEYCQKENLDFKLLMPLILSGAERLTQFSAKELQTGPAYRNDVITLNNHLKILASHPRLKYLYLKLTDSIMNDAKEVR